MPARSRLCARTLTAVLDFKLLLTAHECKAVHDAGGLVEVVSCLGLCICDAAGISPHGVKRY